ncbi:MAG: DUF3846 domain-containing protein [Bacteroidales bacterium]|nr:DUF3846 domain-containing protein [Bacteroidales bacterium]
MSEEQMETLEFPYLVLRRTRQEIPVPAIIKSDGTAEYMDTPTDLKDLQEAVGGFIERVSIPALPGMVMIVNEEGVICRLPLNPVASEIAGRLIVGDVVLMEKEEEQ